MARTDVSEYTRTLANGTEVKVHQHHREFDPAADPHSRRTPVESHRKERLKRQACERRQAALERGKAATARGWEQTQKRGRRAWRMTRSGGRRLRKAARYASRKRRTMAAACLVGGVAEITAAVAWSTTGLVVTTVSILAATIAGGLYLGGKK